ncbi:hypothetical protein ANN_06556 [Periplaneta americana]|uniref:Uncharacterized protein n=1 Tax=Periplaneta americana TaxID=6978 RepID=A0ABQ8TE10_PERAM|nr:hypothetical protein ANN_06556 [Periplaneta americana]
MTETRIVTRALGKEWELIPQEDIANQIESTQPPAWLSRLRRLPAGLKLRLGAGFPGYPVQPMFLSGQVMAQQNPAAMMVHGQQSLGQPNFPGSPYQSYPPVQHQPGPLITATIYKKFFTHVLMGHPNDLPFGRYRFWL